MLTSVLVVILLGGSAGNGASLPEVLDRMAAREEQLAGEIRDASFLASYAYREWEADGRLRREETCTRRVYAKDGRQHVEFLTVAVNGRELTGRARDRQIAALRSKGLVQDQTPMPFVQRTRDEYSYELLGSDTVKGIPVWRVGFEPRRPTSKHIRGWSYISQETHDQVQTRFVPARLPWVVADTDMKLDFDWEQGYLLPDRFEMNMDLRIRFIVTLLDRRLRIEDRFTDYRFNSGLPDSLFGPKK